MTYAFGASLTGIWAATATWGPAGLAGGAAGSIYGQWGITGSVNWRIVMQDAAFSAILGGVLGGGARAIEMRFFSGTFRPAFTRDQRELIRLSQEGVPYMRQWLGTSVDDALRAGEPPEGLTAEIAWAYILRIRASLENKTSPLGQDRALARLAKLLEWFGEPP
jgi:hypothetical protein